MISGLGGGGTGATGPAGPTGASGVTGTVAGATYQSGTVRIGDGNPLVEAALLGTAQHVVALGVRTGISAVHVPSGAGNGVTFLGVAATNPASGIIPTMGVLLWCQSGVSGLELWAHASGRQAKLFRNERAMDPMFDRVPRHMLRGPGFPPSRGRS
jgi:hypothetical protein